MHHLSSVQYNMYLNSGKFLIVLLEVGRSFVRHSVEL